MIAKSKKTETELALAIAVFSGLALLSLIDAQNCITAATPSQSKAASNAATAGTGDHWDLQTKVRMAETGNQWAAYDLWDAYYRGKHGLTQNPAEADKWLDKLLINLWVVRFEPVGDFTPSTPQEFLGRINQRSASRSGNTTIGAASFFRTTNQGDKLVGSFLSDAPEELKDSLARVPGIKIISAERINREQFIKYEASQQESLWLLQNKVKMAQAGNKWAAYDLWDAYHRGTHGVQPNPIQADKWLGEFVEKVWVVRFEPVGDFAPTNPGEFLSRINQYSSCRSGQTGIGAASFFRTTKHGDKLIGSFLTNYPDQLKASLSKVPCIKVTSAESVTPKNFIQYEQSRQESL